MRFRFPISSEEIKDTLREIYMDLVNLIGHRAKVEIDVDGTYDGDDIDPEDEEINTIDDIETNGIYDNIDNEIDDIKNSIVFNMKNINACTNIVKHKTNIKFLRGIK